jgi:hypothetical protein
VKVEFCCVAFHRLHTAQAVDVHRLVKPRLLIFLKIIRYAPGLAALLHLEARMFVRKARKCVDGIRAPISPPVNNNLFKRTVVAPWRHPASTKQPGPFATALTHSANVTSCSARMNMAHLKKCPIVNPRSHREIFYDRANSSRKITHQTAFYWQTIEPKFRCRHRPLSSSNSSSPNISR